MLEEQTGRSWARHGFAKCSWTLRGHLLRSQLEVGCHSQLIDVNARGGLIPCHCDGQARAVAEVHHRLNETLAKRLFRAHHTPTQVVLQSSREHLTGTGGAFVHQDHQWGGGLNGGPVGGVDVAHTLAVGNQHNVALVHQQLAKVHSCFEKATSVVSQIKHQGIGSTLLSQLLQRLHKGIYCFGGKGGHLDVAQLGGGCTHRGTDA
mmetsp:Transcript_11085/g.19276  ORF Transcript_11085/g.19276 Transcript_11085/m.19276 type:complete len:206 (+) Transcript_11085:607-1224(+)